MEWHWSIKIKFLTKPKCCVYFDQFYQWSDKNSRFSLSCSWTYNWVQVARIVITIAGLHVLKRRTLRFLEPVQSSNSLLFSQSTSSGFVHLRARAFRNVIDWRLILSAKVSFIALSSSFVQVWRTRGTGTASRSPSSFPSGGESKSSFLILGCSMSSFLLWDGTAGELGLPCITAVNCLAGKAEFVRFCARW